MPRYKHGKIEKAIDLNKLGILMERVNHVDRSVYSVEFIQALIAIFYWCGYRASEILGDSGHKWMTKKGLKRSKPFPGLLKENIWVDEEFLYVLQVARKHGHREEPATIPLILPYVDLIVKQWQATQPGKKVFPITYVTFWRILKRVDPKIYPHYFAFNRVTKLAENEDNSLAQICAWTGKSPKTVSHYLARAGRYSKPVGQRLLRER